MSMAVGAVDFESIRFSNRQCTLGSFVTIEELTRSSYNCTTEGNVMPCSRLTSNTRHSSI